MSPSDALQEAVEIVVVAVAVYVVYRALTLRGALIDHPYRTRALWTAVGGLTIVSFFAASILDGVYGETPSTVTGVLVEGIAWGFTFIALYGWIASNINVALSADFFHRDALFWKKGGGVVAIVAVVAGWLLASLPSWWLPSSYETAGSAVVSSIFATVVLYATVTLVVTYRRIADRRIKTYTKWVVLSIASVLLLIIIPSPLLPIAIIAWIFCIYQSVGALAIRTRALPT